MADNLFTRPIVAREVLVNPSREELRAWARHDERTTCYGSASYVTRVRSRSAKFTEIVYDEPNPEQARLVNEAQSYLKGKRLIQIDRTMGQNPETRWLCRFYVPVEYARLAYMWGETLFPPQKSDSPDILVVDIPDFPERKILVDPKSCTTYILGSDYMGEVKKANLRLAMWRAKQKGWLGLHAASKLIRVHDRTGQLIEKGVILFGLSGTGKTTLTCHHHFLSRDEGVKIRQDDVILLRDDSYCIGTENNFYLKTEGLEPKGQPLLYQAAASPNAILENVWVDEEGRVDFLNYELTSNGRGVVYRGEMRPYTDESIDLPRADLVCFITRRNDVVPPVARLSPEQGAAFFMLGESIETSAGDPTQAGKSLRVVGTNPFIVGPEFEEGNRILSILKKNPHMQCFVLNTGRVGGPEGEKITVVDSAEIIKQLVRGGAEWQTDPDWGYEVPIRMDGVDMARFDPARFYSEQEYKDRVEQLRSERKQWLGRFSGLDPEIVAAIP